MTMDTDKSLDDMSPEQLRKTVLHYKEQLASLQEDYDQLSTHSHEMDAIYEDEAREAKKTKDMLESRVRVLTSDIERTQTRYETEKKEWLKMEDTLKAELKIVKEEREKLRSQVRTLEQKNDDLERAERNSTAAVEDLRQKVEETLEKCALLEAELAEKCAAEENSFRLREEMKFDRPRMAVEPLRVEKLDEAVASSSTAVNSTNGYAEMDTTTNGHVNGVTGGLELTPRGTDKGFAGCVNRIVKDLLVKVDRLEGILTNLRVSSQQPIHA